MLGVTAPGRARLSGRAIDLIMMKWLSSTEIRESDLYLWRIRQ